MRVMLASDPTIVIALTDCAPYSNGFEFLVAVLRQRRAHAI
jgi:hypothetical protein